ncbi:hypothetical protein K2173_007480 [Erythroxylum novogranatense]|uniref:Uncharacterized protein n=1 Tax=Erythroxylum novogranatense TaxID=1862640 RepID=A0AAV8T819_9ROSI|nr:hypothetical protein K2173_007480 [Erythroxylum novogranatense]
MEAKFVPLSDHQSLSSSPHRPVSNPRKKGSRGFVARPTKNLPPMNNIIHGSLLYSHTPSLSFSCPPSVHIMHPLQQRQPPILPLPISQPHMSVPNSLNRGLSLPPASRKNNRNRDHTFTSKKAKKSRKRDEPKHGSLATKVSVKVESPIISSTSPSGPDPSDLPKDVFKVLSSSISSLEHLQKFSCSVFTLSPPPSSLPLPKFSMKPKALSCTAEAVGVDAGATDNLRRLLRLR